MSNNYVKIIKHMLACFLIPEGILVFVSGIMLSTSINMATSMLPDSIRGLGIYNIVAMVLMFFTSGLLMTWAVIVKPKQEVYSKSKAEYKWKSERIDGWYSILKTTSENGTSSNKTIISLLLLSVASILSTISSLILIVF